MVFLSLLLAGASARAQETASASQNFAAALATSLPFDLEPQVERASFDLRRPSLREMYNAIAAAYGVSLVYDRDLGELPMESDFRLQDVTLQEALEAAGSISRTFVAPLDPRTGIVAADTPEKRGEYERVVLGSFHMDDQLTPQQLTEISVALRNIVDLRRVSQDSRSGWITVRGRTRQVAVADQFLQTLQKTAGEVLLEVDVWEIDLQRARQLGLLPPQPFQLLFLGQEGSGLSPLQNLGQLGAFYGLHLPGLTAFLRSSSSLVRLHQTLYLRASDSQQARALFGERFPVVNSVLSSTITEQPTPFSNASGFLPDIQFQDVGFVVQATPYLHAGRELTLQLDLALRNLGPLAPNGLPTFTNRQLTSQVRLRDGEEFLLSGLLSNSDRQAVTGYPWLSQVPLVGWLFGNRSPEKVETELLVRVRARTLRLDPAEEFASPAIFFGKELTGLPAAVEPPPPQPPPGQPPQPGAPPQPGVPAEPGVTPPPGQVPPGTPVPGVFPPGVIPPGVPQPVVPQPQPTGELPRQLVPFQPPVPPPDTPEQQQP